MGFMFNQYDERNRLNKLSDILSVIELADHKIRSKYDSLQTVGRAFPRLGREIEREIASHEAAKERLITYYNNNK